MIDKASKNLRVLDIYARLCEGRVISKAEEAERFGIDERSIQRDIDDIRSFLDERQAADARDTREVQYDRMKKGFVLTGHEESMMTNSEILAVSKILLESRAFTKKEISRILDKLVQGCVPIRNMKLVSDLIANEKYHYVELSSVSGPGKKQLIQDKLWEMGTEIKEHQLLEIKYKRRYIGDKEEQPVKRIIEPVALLFSEYYFYLNAFIVERDEKGKYVHVFDYPAIFRLDRIKAYKEIGERFQVSYSSRFEEGEFRKRVQFMYPGELMKLQIRYSGMDPEPVLDRLPTARVLSKDEGGWLIEAQVYGKGILMWLLSQGQQVEVIKPLQLREEMKEMLSGMLGRYS